MTAGRPASQEIIDIRLRMCYKKFVPKESMRLCGGRRF